MTEARKQDPPDVAERVPQFRRRLWRQYVYAGLIAFVVSAITTFGYDRDSRDRVITNCESIQDDRRDRAEELRRDAGQLDKQADTVLGNPKSKPPIPPFKFKGSVFEEFEAIIVAGAKENREQAKSDRAEAKRIEERVEDCEKLFPVIDILPFI